MDLDARSAPARRRVAVPDSHDLRGTLAPLRLGAGDRTVRFAADGVWRATRTPEGAATGHYRPVPGDGVVAVEAWGPGAGWLVEHAPALLGCDDDVDGFDDLARRHPVVARAARRRRGLRLPSTLAVCEAALPAVLSQKVTGIEAKRAWRGVVTRWGEPAPGPVPLRLPPAPSVLAAVPYHAFHPLGVEQRRAETLRRVAAGAPRDLASLAHIGGVGPWTVAEVARVAAGDADAVSVGDYHLPGVVCFALAGERRGDDDRMLELLAPFAPHRGRVCLLLETNGPSRPRRGPRLAPIDNRRR